MSILDITAAEYHADLTSDRPTLSASTIKTLLNKSPKHAWTNHPKLNPNYQRDHDDKFNLGTIVHSLILEDDSSNVQVVNAPDWRTKFAKEAKEWAREYGRIPILKHQWDEAREAVDRIRENISALNIKPAPFTAGQPEQSIVWEDAGVKCRALLDWWHTDQQTIDDLKTTMATANPEAWTRRTLFDIGADIQAAFYMRGVEAIVGVKPAFRFIVAETTEPYAVSVVSLGPDVLELANRKIDTAVRIWQECLTTDRWPSYPTDICWAELPAWQESQWLARELREAS